MTELVDQMKVVLASTFSLYLKAHGFHWNIEGPDFASPLKMIKELELDNARLKTELTNAYKLAEDAGELGLSNFLQDRIDIHAKHGWFLKSIGKS